MERKEFLAESQKFSSETKESGEGSFPDEPFPVSYSQIAPGKLFEKISAEKLDNYQPQKPDLTDESTCHICKEKLSFFPKFRKMCKFCNKKVCHGHSSRRWKLEETKVFNRICDVCLHGKLKKKLEDAFLLTKDKVERSIKVVEKDYSMFQTDLNMKLGVLANFKSDVCSLDFYFSLAQASGEGYK